MDLTKLQELEKKEEPEGETIVENNPEQRENEKPQEEISGENAKFVSKAAVPQTTYKPPPEVPQEKSGEGVNKKVLN